MVTPPIQLERKLYRGSKQSLIAETAEWNRRVERLEKAINTVLTQQTRDVQKYSYGDLARQLGFDLDFTREVCFSIDGGHNGFTITKPADNRLPLSNV